MRNYFSIYQKLNVCTSRLKSGIQSLVKYWMLGFSLGANKAIILICLICVICSCVTGCVVTKVHTMPVEKYNAGYDIVWDNVITYLNREKEPIIVCDKEKGIIATDWVIMEKVFAAKRYRYDIQIIKLGENEVQVGIASPQEAYSMGDWEEMLPSERRAHRIFMYIKDHTGKTMVIGGIAKRPFNKRQVGIPREEK